MQAEINYRCCCSAAEKLIEHHSDITANEFRVIYSSLVGAQLINQGVLDVDSEIRRKCNGYLFSINKLVSAFDEQIS